jgi:hypothetical protein
VVFIQLWIPTTSNASRLITLWALQYRDLSIWWDHLGAGEPGFEMRIDIQRQWCMTSPTLHVQLSEDIVEQRQIG